jgi:hypothetical protein
VPIVSDPAVVFSRFLHAVPAKARTSRTARFGARRGKSGTYSRFPRLSWMPEESQIESCEHQDNANIHHQSLPDSVSKERDIQADYDGYHRQCVKRCGYLSAHSAPFVRSR